MAVGLLDEAVEIANYFLPRGKVIVTTKGKIKQASNTYKTLREPLDLDIPIAVLVNSGTASASGNLIRFSAGSRPCRYRW